MTTEHILEKLITFKTVTGTTKEVERLFQYVKDMLQPVPLHVREYSFNGHPMLVITPTRKKRVKLWLAAHVDVVPGNEEQFEPKVRGGKLYARGAYDMKFAVAAYLALLQDIGSDVDKYDIGVMLTADEELGMDSGVTYLLEEQGFSGEVAFLPDGTGTWQFEEAVKGMWQVELTAKGVPSHGSRPWLGRSAIHELAEGITFVRNAFEQFRTNDPEHWYTTVHCGIFEGGEAYNRVAAHATARLDIRYVSKQDRSVIHKILKELKERYPHIKNKTLHHSPTYGIARANGYAKTWAKIAHDLYGIECGWARAHGRSDALWFNKAGIPTILIGPNGGGSHGDREWVDIRDLERYYAILRVYIDEVARIPR
jgi:succinyl-diaminopimelate desuccinylase